MRLQRVAGSALLTGLALLAIGALTLRSAPNQVLDAQRTPLSCLVCGDVGGADVLLNLALFAPLGFGLAGLGRSLRVTLLAAFLVSFSVELLQYTVIVGRDATLSDLLTNTAGAGLGWLVARRSRELLTPSRRTARTLAMVFTALWVAVFFVSAWALHAAPSAGTYWAQWAHDFPARGTFAGRVTRASLDGAALPDGPLPNTAGIRRRLASSAFDLSVDATSGRKWEDNAQIFGLANDEGDIFLEWRQKNRDYEFTMRSRAALLRLHSPELLLRDAAPDGPGHPITLRAEWRDGVITATAEAGGRITSRRLVLSPSSNWSFVWPWARDLGARTSLIGTAWLGATVMLLGFWAAAEGRQGGGAEGRGWVGVLCLIVIAGALGAGPMLFGLQRTSAADWMAAALGAVLGCAVGYMPSARRASGP